MLLVVYNYYKVLRDTTRQAPNVQRKGEVTLYDVRTQILALKDSQHYA